MKAYADFPSAPAAKLLSENRVRYLAQSALTGIPMRDYGPAPILPADQAADVVRWQYPQLQLAA
jgi:hypothetical protein